MHVFVVMSSERVESTEFWFFLSTATVVYDRNHSTALDSKRGIYSTNHFVYECEEISGFFMETKRMKGEQRCEKYNSDGVPILSGQSIKTCMCVQLFWMTRARSHGSRDDIVHE